MRINPITGINANFNNPYKKKESAPKATKNTKEKQNLKKVPEIQLSSFDVLV